MPRRDQKQKRPELLFIEEKKCHKTFFKKMHLHRHHHLLHSAQCTSTTKQAKNVLPRKVSNNWSPKGGEMWWVPLQPAQMVTNRHCFPKKHARVKNVLPSVWHPPSTHEVSVKQNSFIFFYWAWPCIHPVFTLYRYSF